MKKRAQLVDLVSGGDGIIGPRIKPERGQDGEILGYRVTNPQSPDVIYHVDTMDQAHKLIRIGELAI